MTDKITETTKPDCEECHGRVDAGTYCPNCGLSRVDEKTGTFIESTSLPYQPPQRRCCSDASIEILPDVDGKQFDISVIHTHSLDCEI